MPDPSEDKQDNLRVSFDSPYCDKKILARMVSVDWLRNKEVETVSDFQKWNWTGL